MAMVPFYTRCFATADKETRGLRVIGDCPLPVGDFLFTELFCDAPGCECRRVLFRVNPRDDLGTCLATLSYGWETPEYYAKQVGEKLANEMSGLSLDPINEQSEYAGAFCEVMQKILNEDADYVARLKRHYAQFRATLPRVEKLKRLGPRGPAFTPPRKKKR